MIYNDIDKNINRDILLCTSKLSMEQNGIDRYCLAYNSMIISTTMIYSDIDKIMCTSKLSMEQNSIDRYFLAYTSMFKSITMIYCNIDKNKNRNFKMCTSKLSMETH